MSLLTIRRAITDSTGAVVPDATITVKNVATGVTNHTTSNAAGAYLFPALVPVNYILRAEHQGFKAFSYERSILTSASRPSWTCIWKSEARVSLCK